MSNSCRINADLTTLNSNLTEHSKVITGYLKAGVNLIDMPTGFTKDNCYVSKVDYLISGQWRDYLYGNTGVQVWIDAVTNQVNVYGTGSFNASLDGLPVRVILVKLPS